MTVVCELPGSLTIDDRTSLVDLATQDGIVYHRQDKLPRTDDPIAYTAPDIGRMDHPLRTILQGRSLSDLNHSVRRLARFDPGKTGTFTGRSLRQYIDRKENTDVEWGEDDSTGWHESAWLLPQIYLKWCHEVQANPTPEDEDAAAIPEAFPLGEIPAPEPPPYLAPPEPPGPWRLGFNFFADHPGIVAGALLLVTLGFLLLRRNQRLPSAVKRALRDGRGWGDDPPWAAAASAGKQSPVRKLRKIPDRTVPGAGAGPETTRRLSVVGVGGGRPTGGVDAEVTVVSGRRPFASVADVWDPSRPVVIDHTTDKRDIETITQMLEGQIRMVAEGLRPGETIDETTLQATRQAYRTLREIAENLGSEDDVARLIEDEELAWVRELLLGIVTKN